MIITRESENITVQGHIGTWYVVDSVKFEQQDIFLLEHEKYGDEAACLIVRADGGIILDDVRNGWDELEERSAEITRV